MRFRKSISICKGVKMNVSKTGVSCTVGGKGLSLNLGNKGAFLNTSIPGTGLYDRHKLLDFNKGKKKTTAKKTGAARSGEDALPRVSYEMDDAGRLLVLDGNGREVTDEALLRKIKRTDEYQAAQDRLAEAFLANMEAAEEQFLHLHRESTPVLPADQIKPVRAAPYRPRPFTKVEPAQSKVRARLEKEAQEKFPGFFGVSSKRKAYVEENLESAWQTEYDAWEQEKAAFEAEENRKVRQAEQVLTRSSADVEKALRGDADYVETEIDQWLSSMELPVDFKVEYEYLPGENAALIDLDLPEIEDLPAQKAVRMASGAVKSKNKTQKELREDYMRCVFGLAFFFSSRFFALTPCIQRIMIAGYTQRRDKKTGDLEDNYIYSIVFERERFEALRQPPEDPVAFAEKCHSRFNPTATMELKPIEPYVWPDDSLN